MIYKIVPLGTKDKAPVFANSLFKLSRAIVKTYPRSFKSIKVTGAVSGTGVVVTYLGTPIMEITTVEHDSLLPAT